MKALVFAALQTVCGQTIFHHPAVVGPQTGEAELMQQGYGEQTNLHIRCVLWSQPVPDFLEQHFLLVVGELSRERSGDVSEVSMCRHQDDQQRLLDPTSERWRQTGTHTVRQN